MTFICDSTCQNKVTRARTITKNSQKRKCLRKQAVFAARYPVCQSVICLFCFQKRNFPVDFSAIYVKPCVCTRVCGIRLVRSILSRTGCPDCETHLRPEFIVNILSIKLA